MPRGFAATARSVRRHGRLRAVSGADSDVRLVQWTVWRSLGGVVRRFSQRRRLVLLLAVTLASLALYIGAARRFLALFCPAACLLVSYRR